MNMGLISQQAFPSHGRGHRFNPYSAHHFTGVLTAPLGNSRQYQAEQSKSRRGQRVDDVPRSFNTLYAAVHYVGFRDDRYWNAFRIWGGPRVIHRWWDKRAQRDVGPDEIVIFAEGDWRQAPRAFNAPDIDERFLNCACEPTPIPDRAACVPVSAVCRCADRRPFAWV